MRRRKSEAGQALVLFLAAFMVMSAAWAAILLKGAEILDRVRTRNAADAISLSVAVARARGLNVSGTINAFLSVPMIQATPASLLGRVPGLGTRLGKSPLGGILSRFFPERFWIAWNPAAGASKAEATQRLLESLFMIRNQYARWGRGGAPLTAAKAAAEANRVVLDARFLVAEALAEAKGLSLELDEGQIPIYYFGTYKALPVPPYSRGVRNEPLAFRDRKGPRRHIVRVRTRTGLAVYSAARPINRSGPMFPDLEERKKMIFGAGASGKYIEAMNGGWDARLVPARGFDLAE